MGILDFFKPEVKAVPPVGSAFEPTRGGMPKAYIPKFLYKPPYGYPRYVDIVTIRRLAAMPYVEMCISTIIDELCSIEWDIVAKEGMEDSKTLEEHSKQVKDFFMNPNTNKESFEEIRRKYLRDILEVDSGLINKIFNKGKEMVEIVARDGATFTKNPDIYGMMTDREDLILESEILPSNKTPTSAVGDPGFITAADAREKAAYFQYGWISGARPVPFGRREIVWFERNSRTDSVYGRSPIQNLAETIQTLIYSTEANLEYFNDNSIPKGVLALEGSTVEEIDAFKEQWESQQMTPDTAGNWKKKMHNLPIVGKKPIFERFQFTNSEMELLEGQKWWAKLVWACFGVTSVELGYTEDSKGLANQIVQSNVFKKRSINPILRLEAYKINQEIVSEFEFDDVEFKFLLFDVEEETKKATLYQLQIAAGYKSINEIRLEEGMEEVDWGEKESLEEEHAREIDKIAASGLGREGPLGKEEGDQKKKVGKEKEALAGKKKESKSFEGNPLVLRPNEVPGEKRLEESILFLLKINEKKIKELIEKEAGQNKLQEIKALPDLIKAIKSLLTFGGIKEISDAVIKNTFVFGWDQAEKQLDKNLFVNNEAVEFIQDYTFNNIKGMTEDVADDLRQELERGIMEGDSISGLKERVTKVFDVGENRAEMIARTESNRAENQGKLQAFKSSGEKYKKQWLSAKDDRTSRICNHLDGEIIGLDENFKDSVSGWSGPSPPSHVSCRSTLLYILDEE